MVVTADANRTTVIVAEPRDRRVILDFPEVRWHERATPADRTPRRRA
jgi:hypothetical protein